MADSMTRFVAHARETRWGPTDGWKFNWQEQRVLVGGIGVATGLQEAYLKLNIHEAWSDDED